MTEPTELRIALPAFTVAAQVWGDDGAPPLLALHGWLDNAASHARLAPLLARRHRVIALDLPGHGLTDHLPASADYHWPSYVQAVIACTRALGLQRYTLLGHSLGASIASLVAAATPAQVERLLLIEGMGMLGDDGSRTLQRFRDGVQAAQEDSKPLRVFASIEQAARARALASGLPAELARPIIERALVPVEGGWRWRSDPRLTRPTPLRMTETQIHALLRGIEAPTALLLALPTSPHLPNESMARRAACVGDIRVGHMHGGHHLHLEHPQAVADWLLGRERAQ